MDLNCLQIQQFSFLARLNEVFFTSAILYYTSADMGPVVQSIVSLTNSLRGQLVKCFTTLLPNTLIFFLKKREAFAMQKLLTFFQQIY